MASWLEIFGWGTLSLTITCVMIAAFHGFWKKKKACLKSHLGKNVVVIGASLGSIGFGLAEDAVREGCKNLFVVSRTQSKMDKAKETLVNSSEYLEYSPRVHALECDVKDWAGVKQLVSRIRKIVRSVDVIYIAHGIAHAGYLLEQDMEDFRAHMEINYFGSVHVTKAFLPMLLSDEGRQKHIIFMTSGMALVNFVGYSQYANSKWATRSFAETMNQELIGTNVACHICFPGDTETPGYFQDKEYRKDMPDLDILVDEGGTLKVKDIISMMKRLLAKGRFNLVEGFALTASLETTRGLGVWDKCPFIIVCLQYFFAMATPFVSADFRATSKKYSKYRMDRWKKWIKENYLTEEN